MQKQTIQPGCSLTELVAAALGAAREAAIALERIGDIPTDPDLVACGQSLLAGDQPISEEGLEALRELAEALGEAVDAKRYWYEPEGSAAPIEALTSQGMQIQDACRALREARIAAARAIDRSRAEALVAERPR